jgi:hypothetical protein
VKKEDAMTNRWVRWTLLLSFCVAFSGLTNLAAQEMAEKAPPKVLYAIREFVKPGKAGSAHEKSESAFVRAFRQAKWPTHYLAANSLTGRSRTLFLVGYDSFAAWEKDNQATQANHTLAAELDRASQADGELLSDYDATAMVYSEDYSLHTGVDIAHMRYFEIALYRVRPGHHKDWDDLVKLVKGAYENMPDAHWAAYRAIYGQQGESYVIFIPLKSAAEIDQSFMREKEFMANLGEEGVKKLGELEAAAVEYSQSNLFQFDPGMSYASDEWIKADPEFWQPKMPAAKKPAANP